jgi:hypothetical protein
LRLGLLVLVTVPRQVAVNAQSSDTASIAAKASPAVVLIKGASSDGTVQVRIPAMPITHSDLMAITIPSDADHRRSEATLGCSYHAEVIGIRQAFCC